MRVINVKTSVFPNWPNFKCRVGLGGQQTKITVVGSATHLAHMALYDCFLLDAYLILFSCSFRSKTKLNFGPNCCSSIVSSLLWCNGINFAKALSLLIICCLVVDFLICSLNPLCRRYESLYCNFYKNRFSLF